MSRDDEQRSADDPGPDRPLTAYEHELVREKAGNVVARVARQVAKKFRSLVRGGGLMTLDDLCSVGHVALYRAARVYDEARNPEFAAFAQFYVHGAMVNAIDDLLFEGRVQRAAVIAESNYLSQHRGDGYDVMKHDENEARRRYRAFANGQLAATFMAAIEEARHHLDEAEADERRDYEHAIATLDAALAHLSRADQELLALAYTDLVTLRAAAEALGFPYATARAHHARALKVLHAFLVDAGITRAPRPLVVPEAGVLAARAPPQNDTAPDDAEPRKKGPK
jgi:RNA polymerase sigma factor (sigma-70 family)